MALKIGNRNQYSFLPPVIDKYVGEDDPVRVYDAFVETLDFEKIGIDINNNKVGNSSYDPKAMMKLLVYGYSYGIRSSRKLERATKHNLSFIWLMGDLKPDHKTIANYRKNNKKALKEVLVQSAQLCMELNLIDGNILFLDGSKIRGNSSINKTRTKEGLEKQLKQIEEMVEELLKESEKIDKLEEGQTVKLTEELSTTQSRKKKIEEAIKKIKETENRNINITDNESVMIKGRQGTHSGYNAQMVVDEKNGLIVSSNVVSKSNDLGQFSSEIKNANEVLGKKCKTACADAGYFDLKDLNELAKEEIEIIVPNTKQAAHNPKEITIYDKENFKYDKEKDIYICPEGKELRFKRTKEKSKCHEYIIKNKSDCLNCKNYGNCTESNSGRTITRSVYEDLKEKLSKVYDSEEGKKVYKLRKSKVELPFGHIKRNLNGGYFLLKGQDGANAEMSLNCSCFNIVRMIKLLGGVCQFINELRKIKLKYA